jgi:hypothetical protein
MPSVRSDLWPPSISGPEIIAPVTILREQAALLGTKTNGLVLASVSTTPRSGRQWFEPTDEPLTTNKLGNKASSEEKFIHSFRLVVPALEDYTYTLFRIEHGIDLYPVRFHAPRTLGRVAKTENEFVNTLRKVLSSESTQRVIRSLIAQVQTA